MSVLGALVGGLVGTILLTSGMRAATALGLTRMDLPFLLGTAFSDRRTHAKVIGYLLHFGFGLAFAVGYWGVFSVIGHAGWLLGTLLGLVHALFAGTALVGILLPAVHPRMANELTAASTSPLLEPPGFMMLNYGRRTPLVAVALHAIYGAVVGGFTGLAS